MAAASVDAAGDCQTGDTALHPEGGQSAGAAGTEANPPLAAAPSPADSRQQPWRAHPSSAQSPLGQLLAL